MRNNFHARLVWIVLLAIVVRVAFVWDIRDTLHEPPGDLYLQGVPGIAHSRAAVEAWDEERGYALMHGTDMPKYIRYARIVQRGELLAIHNPAISPLAPLVLFPAYLWLAGNSLIGAMMWQGVMGGLQCLLIALVGRRLVNERAALVAAFLASIYSTFIIYDALPTREAALTLTMLLACWTYLRLREVPSWTRAFLWGGCLGLSIAAKPTMLLLIALLPLGDLWHTRRNQTWQPLRLMMPHFLLAGTVAALIVFPFIWRVHHITGEWLVVRSDSGFHFLMGNNPQADGTFRYPTGAYRNAFEKAVGDAPGVHGRRDRLAVAWGLRFWREQPSQALRLLGQKIIMYVSPEEIPNNISVRLFRQISFLRVPIFATAVLVWPLAVLGFFVCWRERQAWRVFIPFMVGYSMLVVSAVITARYRLPLIPFALLLAGAGVDWLWTGIHQTTRDWQRIRILALIGIGVLLGSHQTIDRRLTEWVLPSGQVTQTKRGVLISDTAWAAQSPYGSLLKHPAGSITKEIILPDPRPPLAAATVVIECDYGGKRNLIVRVNEHERPVSLAPRPALPGLISSAPIRLRIPPAWLKPGRNRIEIAVSEGTWLRVIVGDDLWYARSWFSETGETPRQREFDRDTYRRSHTAHLPRGEYKIALELIGQ